MIIARDRENAAIFRRARAVGVLERIGRAVDTRPLSVPDREGAIDLGAWEKIRLLAAPDRGRGKIFVEARLETDVVRAQMRARLPQREVIGAQGRAAIAR